MSQADMLSINAVAAKLGLSVHQLRRWELMFGLEIKRGRGQQRQYRSEDMSVLERIKELVEQGWPTSQIRPQLEAEGLVTPKLIGMPPPPGNPEVLNEALIGFRNFTERRFIEISKQIDELRQLLISITLKQELSGEPTSPWQPVQREFAPEPKATPPQEISIGPDFSAGPPVEFTPPPPPPQRTSIIGAPATPKESTFEVGPSSSSFSTPATSFGSSAAAPERRSIIGEPSVPEPPAPESAPPPFPLMTEEEADALLEEESLDEEEVTEDVVAAPPPASTPTEMKEIPLDEENISEDEDEDLDDEEEQPSVSTPTITPVTSSSAPSALTSMPSTTTSGAFAPVGGEPPASTPVTPPTLPTPVADPFKASPFLSSPASPPEPAAPPRPPEPLVSEASAAPPEPEPASSFAPSSPSLTPSAAGDMFSSVIQSVNNAAARETAAEPPPPPKPADDVPFFSSSTGAPPPPVPSPPVPGPGGTPFTPPATESSPFIPTPPSSSSSPFLTPPPAPYMSGAPAPQPTQAFEPAAAPEPEPAPPAPPEAPKAPPAPAQKGPFLGEITDQNYLTILGRALDLVGWSDEQADGFSVSRFKVPHWDELGRSQAEVLIEHLLSELQSQMNPES